MPEDTRKKEVMSAGVFLTASLVIVLDRATKVISRNNMLEGQSIAVLPDIFHLTLVNNKGIAFGLFSGSLNLLSSMCFGILGLALVYFIYQKKRDLLTMLSFGLIMGGTAGNLFDRARFGYVIDFIDLRIWPVFNIADSAITIGAALLAWNILKSSKIN